MSTKERLTISLVIGGATYAFVALVLQLGPNTFVQQIIGFVAAFVTGVLINFTMPAGSGTEPMPTVGLLVTKGQHKGRTFALNRPSMTIGRNGRADLVFRQDTHMSSVHARVEIRAGQWFIEDLQSKNGTWLDGKEITQRTLLTPGTHIEVGDTTLELIDPR